MHPHQPTPSVCQRCRHYKPEGRRGGICQMFQTVVQSQWKSCSLAELPFIYYLNHLEPESNQPTAEPPSTAVIAEKIVSQP